MDVWLRSPKYPEMSRNRPVRVVSGSLPVGWLLLIILNYHHVCNISSTWLKQLIFWNNITNHIRQPLERAAKNIYMLRGVRECIVPITWQVRVGGARATVQQSTGERQLYTFQSTLRVCEVHKCVYVCVLTLSQSVTANKTKGI